MARRRGPSLRAQWLGQQLRELREGRKLTLKDAGEYLMRDQGSVSRFENGTLPCRPQDVMALLNLFGVEDKRKREHFDQVSREVWQTGWWDGYAKDLHEKFIDLAWLEDRSDEMRGYAGLVIPGLLQTREYAEEVISAVDPDATNDQVGTYIEFRMTRQRVLEQDSKRFAFILDEAVLRRMVGGPAVMYAQLDHLLALAKQPRIELRVVPFSAGGHPGQAGDFQLFILPEPYPEVSYSETLAGSLYVETDGVERFSRAYDVLSKKTLTAKQSVELISTAREDTS
jgi:transcriptional regulator with XRE-family HTH domain